MSLAIALSSESREPLVNPVPGCREGVRRHPCRTVGNVPRRPDGCGEALCIAAPAMAFHRKAVTSQP